MSDLVSKLMNELISERLSEWVNDWEKSKVVKEWVSVRGEKVKERGRVEKKAGILRHK